MAFRFGSPESLVGVLKAAFVPRKLAPICLEAPYVRLRFPAKNGPRIFGSPKLVDALPQVFFLSRKMPPHMFGSLRLVDMLLQALFFMAFFLKDCPHTFGSPCVDTASRPVVFTHADKPARHNPSGGLDNCPTPVCTKKVQLFCVFSDLGSCFEEQQRHCGNCVEWLKIL